MNTKARLFVLLLLVFTGVSRAYSYGTDSLSGNVSISCFERMNENPLLLNRNIETDALCENACLVPCSAKEREQAFLKFNSAFPHEDHEAVRMYTHYFTYEKSENTEVLFAICREYFPILEKQLGDAGLPRELKYLPAALSAMNPYYQGENGGRGIWQLSYTHAVRYGLQIDHFRDERMNVTASSDAAARYLKALYAEYRSWPMAILAFSGSPALVNRARIRAGSDHFISVVSELPQEYQNKYYIFRALLFIGENFDRNRMPQIVPKLVSPSETVLSSEKIHLGQISEVLQIPLDKLRELNTEARRDIISAGNPIHLPVGYAQNFRARQPDIAQFRASYYFEPVKEASPVNLDRPATAVASSGTGSGQAVTIKKYHTVRKGESLSKIAAKYHVSVSQIKTWNNMRSTKIYPGKKIVVKVTKREPAVAAQEDQNIRQNVTIDQGDDKEVDFGPDYTKTTPNNDEAPAATVKSTPPAAKTSSASKTTNSSSTSYIYYTVKSGDTLYAIGRKYGVSYTKIKEWNGLRSDALKIGQKLNIKKS